eukprot:g29188.t1
MPRRPRWNLRCKEMELLLGAGFLAPEVSEDAHHQSTDYEEVHWRASSYGANFESEIQPGLSRMAETLGDGADVKDFQRLGLRMNHVFKQLGRNALSSYTQHCIVPQFREKANTVMMAETLEPGFLLNRSFVGLFAAQGIVFVEQVSCTVPLALTISQRLGIHAEAAYGQMSRQDLNKILDREDLLLRQRSTGGGQQRAGNGRGIGFSAEPFQTEPEIRFEIPTPEGFRTFGLAEVEQQWQKVQLQEIVPTERLKEFSPRQRSLARRAVGPVGRSGAVDHWGLR